MSASALVVAKAPVPGRVKTRLGAVIGHELAATLAAAALLDTLEACASAFDDCYLALDGSFTDAVDGRVLTRATTDWQVFEQGSGELGARLAHAHERVAGCSSRPVVQLGMDTPQVTSALLRTVAARAGAGAAVLGPAVDGGWWVLAHQDVAAAGALIGVPMSTPATLELTRAALVRAGLQVHSSELLRDVDTVEDAILVARAAPHTRFASAWRRSEEAA